MPMATTLPLVEAGRLKALAIGGAKRSPAMPTVPTVAETIPGFESTSWQGYFVPAGTPRDAVVRLQQEMVKVLKLPDVIERLRAGGNEGIGSTPEEFDTRFRADIMNIPRSSPTRKYRSRTEATRLFPALNKL